MDGGCARFENGIYPNPAFSGLYGYGADVVFRRWGKLEASLPVRSAAPKPLHTLGRLDRFAVAASRTASGYLGRFGPYFRYDGWRKKLVQTRSGDAPQFDEFVVEVWNQQAEAVRLVIECVQNGPRFRSSLVLEPGYNFCRIPFDSMNIDLEGSSGLIRAYPENDARAHLVFTCLDFVTYRKDRKPEPASPLPSDNGRVGQPRAKPADKIKCVIWDLDNTVWEGVLGEQEPGAMRMRPSVRETMLALDARGILQSIASKNDHDHAWRALELLGLSSLFLYPRISWQPKSANIVAIVNDLNIGADSCAFIDDSGFERAEVASGVAGIRVYPETDIPDLINRPEFDVPVTEESRRRREFYVAESARKQSAEGSATDYEEFLRSCQIQATIFQPSEPSHVERSLELLQRTNQLNLSTRRYSRTELDELLGDPDSVGICTQAMDRFGEYGIVGFASLKRSNSQLYLVDFVMSCRVAEKKLENAWFKWLSSAALSAGYDKVYARYVKTARNHVLLKAFTEVGFTEIGAAPTATVLALDCHVAPDLSDIVRIQTDLKAVFCDVRELKG